MNDQDSNLHRFVLYFRFSMRYKTLLPVLSMATMFVSLHMVKPDLVKHTLWRVSLFIRKSEISNISIFKSFFMSLLFLLRGFSFPLLWDSNCQFSNLDMFGVGLRFFKTVPSLIKYYKFGNSNRNLSI